MNAFVRAIGHWWVDFYVLSTVLLLIGWISVAVIRQPAQKLAVIRSVIAGLFVLAALCALPNWSALQPIKTASTNPASLAIPAERSADERVTPVPPHEQPSSPQAAGEVPGTISAEGTSKVAPASSPPSMPERAEKSPLNPTPFGWIFLVGTGLAATWLLLGAIQLGRLRRESEVAPSAVVRLFEKIAGSVALLPRLLVNRRVPSAVALGVWDTTIMIPRPLAEKNNHPSELTCVLAHEWAHVKNGDLRLLAATRLLMLLLWAHPLYWILRSRLRLEQETLADAAAAEITNRHDYAAQLVDWAKNLPASPHQSLASAVGIWEGPSQLRRRVALLLDEQLTVIRKCSRRWQWLTALACIALAVGFSLVTLRPGFAEPDAKKIADVADHADADHRQTTTQDRTDYQRFLGEWEIVSVQGNGGSFMGLSEKSRPGQRITIPHVRAPGPDFEAGKVAHKKSPFVTHWLSPDIEKNWTRDDSLYLYPEAMPKRCTYKASDGTRPHFSDQDNPPEFAIYRFQGDDLILAIGHPKDFSINQGTETTTTSLGTPAEWKWKLVIPNYPTSFNIDPDRLMLLVKLQKVAIGSEYTHSDLKAAAIFEDYRTDLSKEGRNTREHYTAEQSKAWGRNTLGKLLGGLSLATDPDLRKSIALAALGYANSYGQPETSVTLLKELVQLESNPEIKANRYAELGGVYERMAPAEPVTATPFLENARDAFGQAIVVLSQTPDEQLSPRAIERLIFTLSERGQVAEKLYEYTEDFSHLRQAAADYQRGDILFDTLVSLVKSAKSSPPGSGSHGHGDSDSYQRRLEHLRQFRYHEQSFEHRELLVCALIPDDDRAKELLVTIRKNLGERRDTTEVILDYGKARYGLTDLGEIFAILDGQKTPAEAEDK